jgi:hypothetical protein
VAAVCPDAVQTPKKDGKKARRRTLKKICLFRFFKMHLHFEPALFPAGLRLFHYNFTVVIVFL